MRVPNLAMRGNGYLSTYVRYRYVRCVCACVCACTNRNMACRSRSSLLKWEAGIIARPSEMSAHESQANSQPCEMPPSPPWEMPPSLSPALREPAERVVIADRTWPAGRHLAHRTMVDLDTSVHHQMSQGDACMERSYHRCAVCHPEWRGILPPRYCANHSAERGQIHLCQGHSWCCQHAIRFREQKTEAAPTEATEAAPKEVQPARQNGTTGRFNSCWMATDIPLPRWSNDEPPSPGWKRARTYLSKGDAADGK